MSKVKVLFFAADPLSAYEGRAPRLLLDKDVQQIRQKVRAAEHRDALEFNLRLAAQTDDLLQALNETRPQVVHFSGHGQNEGLVLVSADGRRPHVVPAAALTQLFEVFRGDIRVVVLNACFSLPQAEAIAASIGCAIGTRGPISDEGAITFGASFYRAIAFGQSVQAAYDQARTALLLEHHDDFECPELVVRPDVDAARLILVSPGDVNAGGGGADTVAPPEPVPLRANRVKVAAAALILAIGGAFANDLIRDRPSANPQSLSGPSSQTVGEMPSAPARGMVLADSAPGRPEPTRDLGSAPAAVAPSPGSPSVTAGEMDSAIALYRSGNYAAAFPLFLRAAEAGRHEAMGFVGVMYLQGQGTERTPDRAIYWLREAVKERDGRGMNALGVAYEKGDGVDQSYRWARHWYLAAAEEKGYTEAMRNLGSLYRLGLGVAQDHAQALDWYRKAARAGSLDAMVDVGMMYARGLGVARDAEQALHWYRTAAEAGSPRGMFNLGLMYQEGTSVRRDYGEARAWYLRGAEAGSADAMNNMGVLFQNGWGVRRDRAQAISWFRRAAAAGSTVAQGNLAALGVD
jgi:TPR repeat protein